MFVSYDVNDETIERLACRNRELREELDRVKEKNERLGKKLVSLSKENDRLNNEIDRYRTCIENVANHLTGLSTKLSYGLEECS